MHACLHTYIHSIYYMYAYNTVRIYYMYIHIHLPMNIQLYSGYNDIYSVSFLYLFSASGSRSSLRMKRLPVYRYICEVYTCISVLVYMYMLKCNTLCDVVIYIYKFSIYYKHAYKHLNSPKSQSGICSNIG